MNKAKEHERKYEWLQAADIYKKASESTPKEKDVLKAAELQEKIGFCFSRASFQTNTNEEFQRSMKRAIKTYKKTIELYQKMYKVNKSAQIFNLRSTIAILNSWIVTTPSRREVLINKWWNLKKKAIRIFEESKDYKSIGKAYTDLLEYSVNHRMFWLDWYKKSKEFLDMGEKALDALSKTQDNYELTRAYSWTSFYYGFCIFHQIKGDRKGDFIKKCSRYSKQASSLSKKIKDARILFGVYTAANFDALYCQNNPVLALEFTKKSIIQAIIAKDNNLLGRGKSWASWISLIIREENPDTHRKRMEQSMAWAVDSISNFEIINSSINLFPSYRNYVESLIELASFAVNPEKKRSFLKKAVDIGQGFLKNNKWQNNILYWASQTGLIRAFYLFSKTETNKIKKMQILKEAQIYGEKHANMLQQFTPSFYLWRARTQNYLALMETELAKNEQIKKKKLVYLRRAVLDMESCLKIMEKDENIQVTGWSTGLYGEFYYKFGGILKYLHDLTGKNEIKQKAINAYCNALKIFQKTELITHAAESYWQIAKIQSQNDEHLKSEKSYDLASRNYTLVTQKFPQLEYFYGNYSKYMKAWSQIEQAKHEHSIEDYSEAKKHYEKAAILHKTTEFWNYLAPNYLAWAIMEDAEDLSRKENTQQAKQTFQKAYGQFSIAQDSFKQKMEEITSSEEEEMAQKLFEASNLRQKYCQARILMEAAKLLDREGNYLQSSIKYGEAAQNLSRIVENMEFEAERKELEYIAILCQAWQKMTTAEETASSESYLEAATLFEQAKELCFTQKASLWALANSSFCKGLAAKNKFQNTFEKSYHVMANKYVKQAADYYKRAGFKTASEYAKATQRLFDAYVYMNSAEDEVDPEKKTKYYQLADQLLQISTALFVKAKQPEKSIQVKEILVTVREEKALAASLNQVMQAPAITSSTLSFTAPTPTSEVSVGLEQFEHANVQANLVSHVKEVKVGESFCLSIEFVNAGREPALLTRVEEFIPSDFIVVKKPDIYRLEDTTLNMKGKQIAPLKLVEAKLVLQPSKQGVYRLNPKVHYLDEVGQKKTIQLKSIEIKVEEVILTDRVSTGTQELDSLLLGGIPEEYAMVLTGPPSDERESIINNFLEAGTNQDEITFYVTTKADGLDNLLENPNFYLFLCNPKPKIKVRDLPNVFKLRSKTDLTNLSISLAKAYRKIDQSIKKRVCVEIVSDVLVDYGVKATRKWISVLITDLGAKGFTILAVMDPEMHPSDQSKAVLNLFDGEISITQTRDPLECKKSIRVDKLRNQDYIKNPICLTKST